MIILGVDPGLHISGYGVAQKTDRSVILLDCGYLQMSYSKSLVERVGLFHEHFERLIQQWNVTCVALETPFLGKNTQSFLKLGYLRGILYLLAHKNNLTVYEFAPRQVKMAATGHGGASKEQVASVMLKLFPTLAVPKKEDVTDALAIMLCGLWQGQNSTILSQCLR